MSRTFYTAPSNRQLKVGESIKRAMGDILREDIYNPILEKTSIVILEVRVSRDLKNADIFLLPMLGTSLPSNEVLDIIKNLASEIKHCLSKRVVMRYMPELRFHLDDTSIKAAKINLLLKR